MAYHYLLDGYNVLYALPEIPPGSWEQKRAALIRLLRERRPQGKNQLTVVFDSRQGWGERQQAGDLRTVFTAGETADDWISRFVREAPNPRVVIVVSNDQGIRTQIRGTGARFLRVREFLKPPDRAQRSTTEEPPIAADDITEDLKREWL